MEINNFLNQKIRFNEFPEPEFRNIALNRFYVYGFYIEIKTVRVHSRRSFEMTISVNGLSFSWAFDYDDIHYHKEKCELNLLESVFSKDVINKYIYPELIKQR